MAEKSRVNEELKQAFDNIEGDSNLNNSQNKVVFEIVQDYIEVTERFG